MPQKIISVLKSKYLFFLFSHYITSLKFSPSGEGRIQEKSVELVESKCNHGEIIINDIVDDIVMISVILVL